MEPTKVQFNKNSEDRRKKRTKLLLVFLLAIIVLIVAAIAILRKQSFQITEVVIAGTRALDPEVIRAQAKKDFSGYRFLVIPKSNIFLFSKQRLIDQLQNQFPGIEKTDILFTSRNTITIVVTEKEPTDVWCNEKHDCYFIDSSGLIYKSAPVFSDGVYVIFSGAFLQVPENPVRARFVTATDFSSFKQLTETLRNYPASVLEVHLDATGELTLRIDHIKDASLQANTKVLLAAGASASSVIQNIDLLWNDKNFTRALISQGQNLQTIDFRYPGKIYYTFKNASPVLTGDTIPQP